MICIHITSCHHILEPSGFVPPSRYYYRATVMPLLRLPEADAGACAADRLAPPAVLEEITKALILIKSL